jgi:hypothetical protein
MLFFFHRGKIQTTDRSGYNMRRMEFSLLSSSLLFKILKINCNSSVVLCGYETSFHTLREEYRLMIFVNKVLRRIFGANREKMSGSWRRLHNEELHILHASSNVIRVIISGTMRWAGHLSHMGEVRNAYNILIGKPEGKSPLRRWEIILEWILGKIGRKVVD